MCDRLIRRTLVTGALASVVVCIMVGTAMADSIATIEGYASDTAVTLDNAGGQYPVISAILSQPGTVGGKTYSMWSYMVDDGTGSAVVYGTPTGYTTPAVGDTVTVSAKYSPYHQIPELTTSPVVTKIGSGTAPAPKLVTIPEINLTTLPMNVAGYMLALENVTISGISGTFPDGSAPANNLTGTITDSSSNSMTLYYWPTSYSVASANLYGTAIPTGPVNMTGFVSVYNSTPEFTPMTITAVPEPGTLALAATGLLSLAIVAWQRRRKI